MVKVLPCEKPPRTFLESSTGAEWMRRPRGLSTVRVVPTSCGVGRGVTVVSAVGGLGGGGGAREGLDGPPAHPETITSAPPAAASAPTRGTRGIPPCVRQRGRAGIPPPRRRLLEGRNRLRGAIGIVPRSACRRGFAPGRQSPRPCRPREAAARAGHPGE